MPKLPSLSFFAPAFDEEANIEAHVREFYPVVAEVAGDFEFIVVDNGSRDGTAEILQRLGAEFPKLKVVTAAQNRGYGGGLRMICIQPVPW